MDNGSTNLTEEGRRAIREGISSSFAPDKWSIVVEEIHHPPLGPRNIYRKILGKPLEGGYVRLSTTPKQGGKPMLLPSLGDLRLGEKDGFDLYGGKLEVVV